MADDLSARVQAAVTAHARTEAALTDLSRTVKFLSASIATIRDAHQKAGEELGELLGRVAQLEASPALQRRIQHLESMVAETTYAAAKEREFLVADHDAFILALIADHERELAQLRERLSDAEPHSATRLSSPALSRPVGPEQR